MPELQDVCSGPERLSREERERIAARIHSLLFWVGEVIPQEVEVGGRTVKLRDIVFDHLTRDVHTEEERQASEALARLLDERIRSLEREIKHGDVTRSEACGLMNEARSLLRAVDELRSSSHEEGQIKRRELMGRVDDARRWQDFLKDAR